MGERLINGKQVEVEHPTEVWVRHTYDVNEPPQWVSYFKKQVIQNGSPPPLYEHYPIPIKKAKAVDLKKLVTEYVPSHYRSFYSELPTLESDSDD